MRGWQLTSRKRYLPKEANTMPKITALGFIMPVKDLDAAAKFEI